MLCDDLEGWDRGREGEAQEGEEIYTYIIMAYLRCCTAETITTF